MSGIEARCRHLLAPLREVDPEAPEPPELGAEREERVVAAMVATARRGRARPWRLGLGAAGAALALAAGAAIYVRPAPPAHPGDGSACVTVAELTGAVTVRGSDGRDAAVRAGRRLLATERLEVAAGASAVVALPSGAAVRVAERTELALGDRRAPAGGAWLGLARGTVALEVPPLGPGRTLAVATPDATVTVVGTRFTVTVQPASGTAPVRSCVLVAAGQVRVVSGGARRLLAAGERWSSDGQPCDAAPAVSPALPPPPTSAAPSPVGGADATLARARSSVASPATGAVPAGAAVDPPATGEPPTASFGVSTLERQNQLFAAALTARRAGDDARALALLERLLAEHPDSPLASQARRERDAIQRGEPR